MSTKVTKIIDLMKTLTLAEAADLIQQIEENFGVDASSMQVKFTAPNHQEMSLISPAFQFVDVVLEDVPRHKKVAIVKAVWKFTGQDLKHAKKLVRTTPSVVKPSVRLEDAYKIKKHLESYGASVSFK